MTRRNSAWQACRYWDTKFQVVTGNGDRRDIAHDEVTFEDAAEHFASGKHDNAAMRHIHLDPTADHRQQACVTLVVDLGKL